MPSMHSTAHRTFHRRAGLLLALATLVALAALPAAAAPVTPAEQLSAFVAAGGRSPSAERGRPGVSLSGLGTLQALKIALPGID